jgi:AcrR family transcriptional regulator
MPRRTIPRIPPAAPTAPARDRLAAAAFRMFADRGFDATTVEEIADAAGVSRRTFFRHFPTKEDVIFPDHERLRRTVAEQLESRTNEAPLVAACNSVRLVLADYVRQPEVSLLRFALTRKVAALREREVTSVHAYQRLFATYLRSRIVDGDELQIELMAAAVVAGHNATLRRWLRSGGRLDALAELDRAFAVIQQLFAVMGATDATPANGTRAKRRATTAVAVFRTDAPIRDVVKSIETLMQPPRRR